MSAKLATSEIIVETCRLVYHRRNDLLRVGLVFTFGFFALGVFMVGTVLPLLHGVAGGNGGELAGNQRYLPAMFILILVIEFLLIAIFAIGWHRLVLLGPARAGGGLGIALGARELRYFSRMWLCFLGLVALGFAVAQVEVVIATLLQANLYGFLLAASFGYFLLAVGVVCSAFALAVGVITSSSRRERARRQMLDSIAWRGDERVLDVGCGNGFLLIEAAKHLTSGSATGIDLWKTNSGDQSPEVARRNAHLEGVADRVEIKNADARAMPFANSAFDVIVSSLMLHHAGGSADRNQVLREMVRVLKPGGTILLYDVSPLVAGAARQLRACGLGSIERSGGIMALLSARRPTSASELKRSRN